jgi:hypothetical protein
LILDWIIPGVNVGELSLAPNKIRDIQRQQNTTSIIIQNTFVRYPLDNNQYKSREDQQSIYESGSPNKNVCV